MSSVFAHQCVPGDRTEIVGDDAPPDPPLHPLGPVIATAVQPMTSFQPTDPSFDPCSPVAALPKPALALVGVAGDRFPARLRQHDLTYAMLLGHLFIHRRPDLAIARQEGGCPSKDLDMVLQTGNVLRCIVGIACEHGIAR